MTETKTTAKQRADQRRYQARKEADQACKILEARVTALEAENKVMEKLINKQQDEIDALHKRISILENR